MKSPQTTFRSPQIVSPPPQVTVIRSPSTVTSPRPTTYHSPPLTVVQSPRQTIYFPEQVKRIELVSPQQTVRPSTMNSPRN